MLNHTTFYSSLPCPRIHLSPSLLPPGSDFVEDNLSLFQGAERWFQDALGTLLLSCTFFLFLLYPFHLRASGIRLQRLGTPGRTGRLRPNPAYHPLLQIKFYWHTVTLIQLYILQGCFWATTAEGSSHEGDQLACKAENIYFLALYRKRPFG